MTTTTEALAELLHNAYERAAYESGWETQTASRRPWAEVPYANKQATLAGANAVALAVAAILSARITERRIPYTTTEAGESMYQRGIAFGLDAALNIVAELTA